MQGGRFYLYSPYDLRRDRRLVLVICFSTGKLAPENHCTRTTQLSWVGCSLRGHRVLFRGTVIHSMSKFFTSVNFHFDFFFHLE